MTRSRLSLDLKFIFVIVPISFINKSSKQFFVVGLGIRRLVDLVRVSITLNVGLFWDFSCLTILCDGID